MERVLAGDIGAHEGREIRLLGWVHTRRDHGKLIFIDFRDRSGLCQAVTFSGEAEAFATMNTVRPEWVIEITGVVNKRPEKLVNKDIASGQWEVGVKTVRVINEAETLPIAVDTDGKEIGEEHRLKYRYLDLRRARLQKNLRNRHKVISLIRQYLTDKSFVEIETPIISKSTPEGARDYLVPSRLEKGSFYALPQSPQQYKQLLMVGGMERYFQIARCFRDEDTRGDRQPEFTQLDIEMSFTTPEEVMQLLEELYTKIVKDLYPHKKIMQTPFPRLSYKEAMEKYGSDKPDLRKDKNDPDELAFAFVVDFPMFEWKEREKRWDAVHHPFTQPKVESVADFDEKFATDPGEILAMQYDFVLNGYEIGGGSIRIHDPKLLSRVFEVMGNSKEEIQDKFGHILTAFQYGVPPHGGVAPGIDRLMMILENEPNIREVIAFPKTGDGRDIMMSAPSKVRPEQLRELGVKIDD
ncbi:MAG: aspartate--tRNA ligase [Candidatus Harrisonbacteria bacterium]|nr:aspartate--tRNA ligase [Candidatus Harrisonbacteria bacterium]